MNINNYLITAKKKVSNKPIKTFILAVYAGIFIALAGTISTVVSLSIDNYSLAKILSGLVFPIGLVLVILLKTELFTGNSLLVIPLLQKDIKIKELLKNWVIVFLGNLCGSLIIALLITMTPLKDLLQDSLIKILNTKIAYSFKTAIILGILCNFLVCIAVFLATNAKTITEKIIVIYLPIFTFIVLSFEHSIANMFYLSVGYILDNSVKLSTILINNLLPVTIGNIIGGTLLGLSIWYLKESD